MSKHLWNLMGILIVTALLSAACAAPSTEAPPPEEAAAPGMKACYIYVGPIGDYGWTHAHDQGRLYVEGKFDWLETAYAESVPEADADRFLDRFVVEEGCDVIFTTSFGFMDGTIAAAEK